MQKADIAAEGALPYPPVCCVLFLVKSGVVLFCVTSALWKKGINLPGFAPELQGVYIEEHDGRKQVWCYVIKPRDAQSALLKGEKIMSQAKSNKMGVVQLTILTMVNMMGSGIIMLPTKLAEVGTISIISLAGDSRRLNGTGMGIRKMRYVQP